MDAPLGGVARARGGPRAGPGRGASRLYVSGLENAAAKLVDGELLTDATRDLLQLHDDGALLPARPRGPPDRRQRRAGQRTVAAGKKAPQPASCIRKARAGSAGRTSSRELRAPGRVHLTAPYLSINEAHLCVTASVAAQTPRGLHVPCVDINHGWWRIDDVETPDKKPPLTRRLFCFWTRSRDILRDLSHGASDRRALPIRPFSRSRHLAQENRRA